MRKIKADSRITVNVVLWWTWYMLKTSHSMASTLGRQQCCADSLEKETCKSRLSWHSMQHSQTAVTTENSQCIMQTSFPEKEGQLNNLFFQWLDRICVVFPTWREVGDRQAEQVDAVAAGPQGSGTRGVSAPLSGLVLVALPAALTMVSPHSRQMQQGQRTKRVRWSCPFLCLWALISNAFRLREKLQK